MAPVMVSFPIEMYNVRELDVEVVEGSAEGHPHIIPGSS
jgi:hypothetical protein